MMNMYYLNTEFETDPRAFLARNENLKVHTSFNPFLKRRILKFPEKIIFSNSL